MIAFVCAMPMELKQLVKQLGLHKAEIGGVPVRRGELDGHDVVAIATGMGTALATSATERLLGAVTPVRVVVFGITGAVEDDTPIGTLVLPELVVNSNTGSEHRPERLGAGTPRGTMWTTDVMTPPEQLAELRAKGVVALDMETAAIAESCERRAIPWSVFRVISDGPSDGIDDEIFKLGNQDGTPNPRRIASYIVRHPLRIPHMAKLAKGANLATTRAAAAAIAAARTVL